MITNTLAAPQAVANTKVKNSLTRHSNTGLNLTCPLPAPHINNVGTEEQDVFIDWLTFNATLNEENYNEFLMQFLIGEYWDRQYHVSTKTYNKAVYRGGSKFRDKVISENGIECLVTPQDEGNYRVLCRISGKVLGSLIGRNNALATAGLIYCFDRLGFNCSRIDIAIQDSRKVLNLRYLSEQAKIGNFTGVRKFGYVESGNYKDGITGVTLYMGSRQSESFYRFYDTFAKHEEIGNRIENELKDSKAKEVQDALCIRYSKYLDIIASMQSFRGTITMDNQLIPNKHICDSRIMDCYNKTIREYLISVCLGNIDFIDRSKQHKNGSLKNCPRLSIWQRFIDYCLHGNKPIKVKAPKRIVYLKEKFKWLHKCVKKTLGVFRQGLMPDDFKDILNYLFLAHKDKEYPKEVQQTIELEVGKLKDEGVHALMSVEEMQEIDKDYDIQLGYFKYLKREAICYEDNEWLIKSKKSKLYREVIEQNPDIMKPIYDHAPIVFQTICKFLKEDEKQLLIGYLSNWEDEYKPYRCSLDELLLA